MPLAIWLMLDCRPMPAVTPAAPTAAIRELTLTCSAESAESAVATRFRLPGQVKGLKATSKEKKVTLKWTKVTGAKKYFVYVSKNGKTGWKKVGTVPTNKFVYEKGKAGKKLYFKVQAVTANGKKGEFSKVIGIKVKK